MEFYQSISGWYKFIFPAREEQLSYFHNRFSEYNVSKVLDVACGTGEYTISFAEWGLEAVGADLDPAMIKAAKWEAEQKNIEGVKFLEADMTELPFNASSFDAAICIGNSIVHLLETEEILKALKEMARVINTGGILVIQTVNYDRILDQKITQLPTITDERAGIIFERYYSFNEDGTIEFHTILNIDKHGKTKTIENSVPLRPLRLPELQKLLAQAGLRKTKARPGFSDELWTRSSFATVVEAVKE